MSEATHSAIRTAACIAFRHLDEVSDSEREQVLIALVDVLPARESELAQTTLYHLREQRKAQLELAGILDAQRSPLRTNS